MFDAHDLSQGSGNSSRRRFLITGGLALGSIALYRWNHLANAAADSVPPAGAAVLIVPFDPAGHRLAPQRLPRVVKSDAAWRRQLSSGAYSITRKADTEFPYSGAYWNSHNHGLYRCICCDSALFSSETKFDSGTGWPSFWQPIARENVTQTEDTTLGMARTAVSCTLCDAHLGHVFHDGPDPTGLRYCMNSASLSFRSL